MFYFGICWPALSGSVDYPIVPVFVFVGYGPNRVCAGGCSDVPCPLTGGVAGGSGVIRPDAVSVRRAEPDGGPLVLDSGF